MSNTNRPPIIKQPLKVIAIICISVAMIALIRQCNTHQTPTDTPTLPRPASYQKLTGKTMGTSYHITFKHTHQDMNALSQAIDERLITINKSMSTYDDNATIMAFNRAGANTPIVIDDDFRQVFYDSLSIYRKSGGAFDPTVKPLVDLWGFGKQLTVERLQSPPQDDEIAKIRPIIGLDKVILQGNVLTKTTDGVALDFSAIAKGYGVDAIAAVLQSYGIFDYMVEIGGEIATQGNNANNNAWHIAIDEPIKDSTVSDRQILIALPVHNAHIATSGNYRHSMTWQGVQYSHTIDPTTFYPVKDSAPSVTVLHDSTALADGWATALTAMPFDKAITLANNQHIKALFVIKDPKTNNWQLIKTHALEQYAPDKTQSH